MLFNLFPVFVYSLYEKNDVSLLCFVLKWGRVSLKKLNINSKIKNFYERH